MKCYKILNEYFHNRLSLWSIELCSIIKNCNFENCNSKKNGGAIAIDIYNHFLTILSCSFILCSNIDNKYGGSIYFNSFNGNITLNKNCFLKSNSILGNTLYSYGSINNEINYSSTFLCGQSIGDSTFFINSQISNLNYLNLTESNTELISAFSIFNKKNFFNSFSIYSNLVSSQSNIFSINFRGNSTFNSIIFNDLKSSRRLEIFYQSNKDNIINFFFCQLINSNLRIFSSESKSCFFYNCNIENLKSQSITNYFNLSTKTPIITFNLNLFQCNITEPKPILYSNNFTSRLKLEFNSKIYIKNCIFYYINFDFDGGAIYYENINSISIVIIESNFINCKSNEYGGCICIFSSSSLILINKSCCFECESENGQFIYSITSETTINYLICERSSFNFLKNRRGVLNINSNSLIFSSSNLTNNFLSYEGFSIISNSPIISSSFSNIENSKTLQKGCIIGNNIELELFYFNFLNNSQKNNEDFFFINILFESKIYYSNFFNNIGNFSNINLINCTFNKDIEFFYLNLSCNNIIILPSISNNINKNIPYYITPIFVISIILFLILIFGSYIFIQKIHYKKMEAEVSINREIVDEFG